MCYLSIPYDIHHMQASLSNKSAAPQLQMAYLHCVLALWTGEEESPTAKFFKPILVHLLERVSSSPSPQPALLREALMASHVLVKITYPGAPPSQVWTLIESLTEQLVISKVISAASVAQEGSSTSGEMTCHVTFR